MKQVPQWMEILENRIELTKSYIYININQPSQYICPQFILALANFALPSLMLSCSHNTLRNRLSSKLKRSQASNKQTNTTLRIAGLGSPASEARG